jgi:exopolysaccharide biosynthesis polyprenyl glycosylphosphotransferase
LGRNQRVLIVGAGEVAEAVSSRLRRYGGLEVVGMVDDHPLPGFETIGTVADIGDLCSRGRIDRIIVALPRTPWLEVSEALQPLIGKLDIAVVPSLHELVTWRSGTQDLAGMPLIPLVGAQHSSSARLAKRAMDLFGAAVALFVLSPVLLVAIAAIRLESEGPVIFRQQRAGRGHRPFTIYKLRTMRVGSDGDRDRLRDDVDMRGGLFKLTDDPRVTRVGSILRRFSIDELPQLVNVLLGNMSLVGPRPYPFDESEALRTGPAASRFEVLPGMTGLWQVSGRSDLTWDDLCRLDAIYVRSWSLAWDLRILLQTPAAVIRSDGAY